jgi:hypothetical protein
MDKTIRPRVRIRMRIPPSGFVYFEHLMPNGALLRAYTIPMLLLTMREVYKGITPLPRGYSWGSYSVRLGRIMTNRLLLASARDRP